MLLLYAKTIDKNTLYIFFQPDCKHLYFLNNTIVIISLKVSSSILMVPKQNTLPYSHPSRCSSLNNPS